MSDSPEKVRQGAAHVDTKMVEGSHILIFLFRRNVTWPSAAACPLCEVMEGIGLARKRMVKREGPVTLPAVSALCEAPRAPLLPYP